VTSDLTVYSTKGDHRRLVRLPEKWDEDLAHYLGWMVGDGSVGAGGTLSAVYGSPEDQAEVLPRHQSFVTWLNGDLAPTPSTQANGTVQLRLTRRPLTAFFAALGLTAVRGPQKRAPWSVFQAPPQIVAAFLRGLFDADGCVHGDGTKGSYVGLGSASRELLVDVQRLLTNFGIACTISDDDLRIASKGMLTFAQEIGFSLPSKASKLEQLVTGRARAFNKSDGCTRLRDMVEDGFELTYNLSEPRNHSYVVNGLVVRNCSEYMHLDNSACNLASINLLAFLDPDDDFDVEGFKAAVEVVFTGQEILVGNADYPTKPIGDTSRRFRQLGLGYANLGALLMAQGIPYDSDAGRAWAGAITALMTGHAYAVSARAAARMGPFAGYHENREPMLEVLRMHRAEVAKIDELVVPPELLSAAQESWDNAVETAEVFGVRNSQASVLAPTGCLVGGSLVPTERGLVRLASLGDPDGSKWQELGLRVATDEGVREASEFYVNGLEPVVTVRTHRGHRLQGTPQHRVKAIDAATGKWEWKRLADMATGDVVPLALDQLIGRPQTVPLPPLPEAYWTGEHHATVPRKMTAELAELVGYFMGDGSLHSGGLRFCVTQSDIDVVERLRLLGKAVFGLEVAVAAKKGYTEVRLDSVRVVLWWEACGFAKGSPALGHWGKGCVAHIPSAVLAANDREIYSAFLRGLYEAGGGTSAGYPTFKTTSLELAQDVQSLLLALGYPTNMHVAERTNAGGTLPIAAVRLLNLSWNQRWVLEIGFMGDRKQSGLQISDIRQAGRKDYIPLSRELVDRLAPDNDRLRKVLLMEVARGRVSRGTAEELYERTGDAELDHLLGFFYDTVDTAELGEEDLTYDLSVPSNVTYIANGFVSHNTIGLLMDCDTTGIEPDLGLVKTKKLVGGGTMSIINQTVPRALHRLGYSEDEISDIVSYVDERKSILGAPHISPDHLAVFACSMGDNTIHYRGHVRMMGAVQPFISGAISKTVNMPEDVTVEEVAQLHLDAWRLGVKAVAIYRDNCKVGQPLSTAKRGETYAGQNAAEAADDARSAELYAKIHRLEAALELAKTEGSHVVVGAVRERLPRRRVSTTFAFRVADCEGYVTVGEYEDGRPGEVFIKVSKQGSTLAGIMDAFSISISLGLQHGVPLATYVRKFANMKFEPSGMTDDADLRLATSLVDYIFRRLALDYLSYAEREELGVLSTSERLQPTLPEVAEQATPTVGADAQPTLIEVSGRPRGTSSAPLSRAEQRDAPMCYQCGNAMQRAGSCYVCSSCGATSGCS
jgi:ribonucleoside-diphosphate reductase alpha chain